MILACSINRFDNRHPFTRSVALILHCEHISGTSFSSCRPESNCSNAHSSHTTSLPEMTDSGVTWYAYYQSISWTEHLHSTHQLTNLASLHPSTMPSTNGPYMEMLQSERHLCAGDKAPNQRDTSLSLVWHSNCHFLRYICTAAS